MSREIVLDKPVVCERIWHNFGGGPNGWGWGYYLIIKPSGKHHIAACERRVWGNDDIAVPLPAPYGDGSARLYEDACEFLQHEGCLSEFKAQAQKRGLSVVSLVEAEYPDEWATWIGESLDWFADEWLRALNEQHDFQFKYADAAPASCETPGDAGPGQ